MRTSRHEFALSIRSGAGRWKDRRSNVKGRMRRRAARKDRRAGRSECVAQLND